MCMQIVMRNTFCLTKIHLFSNTFIVIVTVIIYESGKSSSNIQLHLASRLRKWKRKGLLHGQSKLISV